MRRLSLSGTSGLFMRFRIVAAWVCALFFQEKFEMRERAEAVFCEIGYLGLLKFCCRLRIIS